MGNIGGSELLIILVLALLLLGPKRLPEVGEALGRSLRRFRQASRDLRDELDVTRDSELRSDLSEIRRDLDVRHDLDGLRRDLDVREELDAVRREPAVRGDARSVQRDAGEAAAQSEPPRDHASKSKDSPRTS